MLITDTPRTLVYKDIEDINYFFGDNSERTLEREFYERLSKRPFIINAVRAPFYLLTIFTNARFIYYLVNCEENVPFLSLCFISYLAKATEGIEDESLKGHIAAATMALVHNWLSYKLNANKKYIKELKRDIYLSFDARKENEINELCKLMYLHFSEEKGTLTNELIYDFHALFIKEWNSSTNIDTLFNDIRDIEDAAINAPIQDVASGIEYLMECYDSQYGTNAEEHFFLYKILKRFENEKSLIYDSKIIEKAKVTINRRLQYLESTCEPEPFTLDSSYENLTPDEIDKEFGENDKIISPEIIDHIAWILDINKAPMILATIRQYMEGKTKPKDVLMPLCAALEAGVIRKPTFREYKIVFIDHPIKSEDSYSDWVDSGGARKYKAVSKTKTIFNNLLSKFAELKK